MILFRTKEELNLNFRLSQKHQLVASIDVNGIAWFDDSGDVLNLCENLKLQIVARVSCSWSFAWSKMFIQPDFVSNEFENES